MVEFINMDPFSENDYAINSNGKLYDLHNIADFYSFQYSIAENIINLIWKYPPNIEQFIEENKESIEDGSFAKFLELNDIDLDNEYSLTLKFSEIKNFYITKRDNVFPYEQIFTLGQIYYNENRFPDRIEFEFANSMKIVIFCKKIEFVKEIFND